MLFERLVRSVVGPVTPTLNHTHGDASRGRRVSWTALGVARGLVVQTVAAQQTTPTATSRTRGTVSPAGSVRGISGFGPLF
jgi:hypothetical protein